MSASIIRPLGSFGILLLTLFACDAPSSPGDSADPVGEGKADAQSGYFDCESCEVVLEACLDDAQDGVDLNACLGDFSSCYVAVVGEAVPCPDAKLCGFCATDAFWSQSLQLQSECVLVGAGVSEAATCEPSEPSCEDCELALASCQDEAQDGASSNACLGQFSVCYVSTVGEAIPCSDPKQCGFCADDPDWNQTPVDLSDCVLVGAGLNDAAVCPA